MKTPTRNQPCHCGSGKKYKHCCAKAAPATPREATPATLLRNALELHNQGHLRRAEAMYRQILAVDPGHADALHLLGLTRHQQGHSLEACEFIERALRLQPVNPVYVNNLGEICRALGRFDEAVEHFTRALELRQGNFPEAHRNLGRVLWESGLTERALTQLAETTRLYPGDADTFYTLAEIHARRQEHDAALAVLKQGLAHSPRHPSLLCLKGIVLRARGDLDGAVAHYQAALAVRPDVAELHHNLGLLYQQLGRNDEAARCFEQELSIQPNESARHLLDALRGIATSRAPARYVQETFDAYADQFDDHLVNSLSYRTPELLGDLLDPALHNLDILDLGCGTGLMGRVLRERKRRLVGIDLSPRMIEKARALGCYDNLAVGDLVEWLEQPAQASFDLAVAADVFNYLGDLSTVFERMGSVLAPDGRLLFSIESADASTPDFSLDATGRYRHRPEHIRTLAKLAHFIIEQQVAVTLRREKGMDVAGTLFLLRMSQG